MDGFINVLKPTGLSSHDVIDIVRRIFKQKRVGHAGTLDPAAAGILPVALGRAARLVEYMEGADKSYRTELAFGYATDTGDVYGEVVESVPHPTLPSEEELRAVLTRFVGETWQRPPAYSAIKVGGQRAYDLARQGAAVEIASRTVTIHHLELVHVDWARRRILVDVDCAKGTYIRALCTDIGAALGLPATMRFLLRTRVGGFALADSHTLEELAEAGEGAVCAPDTALDLPCYELDPQRVKAFYSGLSTSERRLPLAEGFYRVYAEGVFLGIGRYDAAAQEMYPAKAFPPV
ncbi:tRNA pseudouridine(55) synthase TruB [Selenomonas sp. oral taxon 126]|uniref:tRNA pseudouridine(55) synthase TruB n=1 Tax=Selenomonas sp. oral taxon 126 TaxID=712528 RepID=UPI000807A106|nr:tRNA pseudouridine(55) synthase TruB [Selenomonas sp. oral taxon 126]ANR69557.1 tRNA pseudouridine(55) synthase TruB [Selenomonas sp. oral taxon 126]